MILLIMQVENINLIEEEKRLKSQHDIFLKRLKLKEKRDLLIKT